MEVIILILCFVAQAALGFFIVCKLDHFLEKNQQAIEEEEEEKKKRRSHSVPKDGTTKNEMACKPTFRLRPSRAHAVICATLARRQLPRKHKTRCIRMEEKTPRHKEHILACISSAPSNAKIIKTAAQMSKAFGGRFTALYVKTPTADSMSRENRERLEKHIALAGEMGAEIVTVYGEDVARQIIEFSRIGSITKVVLGRSNVIGGRQFSRQTITDRIIRAAPGLDVHIIPDTEIKKAGHFHSPLSAVRLPHPKQILLMLLILLLSTGLGYLFHSIAFTEANTITVYVLGVLITALVTKNYICSGVYSLGSVTLFNFLFVEPRFSFKAYESGYPVTFAIMLIASLIVGTLANRLAASATLFANAAYRTNIMLETNQLLQKEENEAAVTTTMAKQLIKLLGRNIIVYPVVKDRLGEPQTFSAEYEEGANNLLTEEERTAAMQTLHRSSVLASKRTKKSCGVYFSVKTNDAIFCIVGVETGNKPIEHFESSILISILGEAALAIENLRNAKEKEEIALLAKNEKLRANLLRAISHDLRTPLTSISGNAENLLANFDSIDEETRKKLLIDVGEDAEWLISLVENLLSISRISEGKMNINLSAQLADEVIAEALRHISRKASEHRIITDFEDTLLLAKMDARLIIQVIINLVDNAIKYTPKGSEIKVSARDGGEHIVLSVADNGNGIPDEQKKDVFRMFYTGNNSIADCRRSLGLGLSLCKSIVNAHGAKLTLSNNHPRGCVFTFNLEKSEVDLGEQQTACLDR